MGNKLEQNALLDFAERIEQAEPWLHKGAKFTQWAKEIAADMRETAIQHLTAQRGEVVAWARNSGDENDDAFVISAKVKRLWMASNPKRVERYTRPLYTTHVPCWALPAVESALSMLDLQGYWHSDLAAFRDWLKEKSV